MSGCACNLSGEDIGQTPEAFAMVQQQQIQGNNMNGNALALVQGMGNGMGMGMGNGALALMQGQTPGAPTGATFPDPDKVDVATLNRWIRALDTAIVMNQPVMAARVASWLCKYRGFDCVAGECAVLMPDGSVQLVRTMPDQAKNCAVDLRYPECTREGWRRQWGRDRVVKVAPTDWKIDPNVPGFFAIELVGPQSVASVGNPWPGVSQLPGHWDIKSIQITNPTDASVFVLRGAQHMWDPATSAPEMVLQYADESPVLNIAVTPGRCACEDLEQCIPAYGDLTISSGVLRLYCDATVVGGLPALTMMVKFCDTIHLPATLPTNCYQPPLPKVVPLI